MVSDLQFHYFSCRDVTHYERKNQKCMVLSSGKMKIDSSNYIIKLLFGSTHIESPHHTLSIHINLLYKDFSTISTLIPKTRKLKARKCESAYKVSM